MRADGLAGVRRGRKRRTTSSEPAAARPPDLVNRQFTAARPDQLWVADLTYVRTWEGWVYVAFVLDVFSRLIVGWQLAGHLRTDLPLDALEMAIWPRQAKLDGLVHHSDAGCQYTSFRYTSRLAEVGVIPSIGSVADSFDNAMAESLNGTFKAELIDRQSWRTRDAVEFAVLEVGRLVQHQPAPQLDRRPPTSRVRGQLLRFDQRPATYRSHIARSLPKPGQLTGRSPGSAARRFQGAGRSLH
jgi:transposase InsO family protein